MATAGLASEYACPQLPDSPQAAIDMIRETYLLAPGDTLVGSSLGGYYTSWLAEKTGCRAVLLNPAVNPARDLEPYVGELRTYHTDQPMTFKAEYLDELKTLDTPVISSPERYFLIAAKGDELLDWREMVDRYPDVRTKLLDAGDHGLSDFAEHIDEVLAFAGLGHV